MWLILFLLLVGGAVMWSKASKKKAAHQDDFDIVAAVSRALAEEAVERREAKMVAKEKQEIRLSALGVDHKDAELPSVDLAPLIAAGNDGLYALSAEMTKDSLAESLELAKSSSVIQTRVSRLEIARVKLSELKLMAIDWPKATNGVDVASIEAEIRRISEEFSCNMFYGHVHFSLRFYQPNTVPLKFQALGLAVVGWRAAVNLEINTPLRLLKMHWTQWVPQSSGEKPPAIDGIAWIAEYNHDILAEAGIEKLTASDIGPLQPDGGEYLQLLMVLQAIAERVDPIDGRVIDLRREIGKPEWTKFHELLCGEDVICSFFSEFLSTIPKLSEDSRSELRVKNLLTASSIAAQTDKELLAIKGIGPAKLKFIRKACEDAEDKDSEWVDCVKR